MFGSRLTPLVRIALALVFVVAAAHRAAAASFPLSDVEVLVDESLRAVSVSAGFKAPVLGEGDLSFVALSVSLSEDGNPVELFDPFDEFPDLDDTPFLSLFPPFFLADGGTLPKSLLFRVTGLVPGASYAGSFFLQFTTADEPNVLIDTTPETFSASITAPAAVPEPATMLLLATGLSATGLMERRRTRRKG